MSSSPSLSVCVFCGSRNGKNPAYLAAARALGAAMGAENMRLVYGAGDVGLMGAVAVAAQNAAAKTFGVIPQHLLDWEVGKRDLDHFIVTETMHERKKLMFTNCDAVVLLPGGAGSLDEFFEVLTWAQLSLHAKPIVVANIDGYWTPLLALVDHIIDEGFADPSLKTLFHVANSIPETLTQLTRPSASA